MTFFIKLEDGQPVGHPIIEQNFRQLFPNISFPTFFDAPSVEPYGYGIYDFTNKPDLGKYQVAVEVTPVRSPSGIWQQTWQIAEMSPEEKIQADELKADQVREERNYRLFKSDWTQFTDSPLDPEAKAAWAFYRENLRMVPQQSGFPWAVNWPPEPAA